MFNAVVIHFLGHRDINILGMKDIAINIICKNHIYT